MYFIRSGSVQIYKEDEPDNPITQLSAGSYFGEFAILAVGHSGRERGRAEHAPCCTEVAAGVKSVFGAVQRMHHA